MAKTKSKDKSSESNSETKDEKSEVAEDSKAEESLNKDTDSGSEADEKSVDTPKEGEETEDKEITEEKEEQEQEKLEPPELTKEDIIKLLKAFPGVGQVMADRIYDAEYDSRDKLKAVTVEELQNIPGIGKALAETIVEGMETAIKQFDEPPKPEEPKAEGPGIADKTVSFFKNTFSKITGFIKGKPPKPMAEQEEKPEDKTPKPTDDSELKPDSELPTGAEKDEKVEKPLDVLKREVANTSETDAVTESYFPEVGTGEEEKVTEIDHEPVTIETPDTESDAGVKDTLAPVEDTEPPPEPERTLKEPIAELAEIAPEIPKFNTTDSSGMLLWFESTPKLRPEAGKILFKAGYNNLGELKEAVIEDLVLVNGINESEAKTIYEELRKLN
jgi:ERCC4-type nuclease